MSTIKHRTNPFIPKPEHKEIPVVEELTETHHHGAPHTMKQDIPILVPRYNTLYDSYRSKQAWANSADGEAEGTITTVAGSAVTVPVALNLPANTQSPNWRLEQWPGGTLLYLIIRSFSAGPQTATFATQGAINILFIDQFGNLAPLGVIANNSFSNIQLTPMILPGAITDSGQQKSLGQLSFTLNAGATVGTYAWQIGFSVAYLLPSLKGYDLERIGDNVTRLGEHHHRND
jgi:hypothetical protein